MGVVKWKRMGWYCGTIFLNDTPKFVMRSGLCDKKRRNVYKGFGLQVPYIY